MIYATENTRAGRTKRILVALACVVGAALILWLLWLSRPPREVAPSPYVVWPGTAGEIDLAFAEYKHAEGHFPRPFVRHPETGAISSWYVHVLPQMHYERARQAYDTSKPWDDPGHKKLRPIIRGVYVVHEHGTGNTTPYQFLGVADGQRWLDIEQTEPFGWKKNPERRYVLFVVLPAEVAQQTAVPGVVQVDELTTTLKQMRSQRGSEAQVFVSLMHLGDEAGPWCQRMWVSDIAAALRAQRRARE